MIVGLILAAGKSERMGTPKPLLPLAGKTFLETVYGRLKRCASLGAVKVVLGHQAGLIQERLGLAQEDLVYNPDYEQGMLSSVQAGLNSVQHLDPEAILLYPVDFPAVGLKVIESLLEAFRGSGKAIVIPTFHGRRGHPVVFGKALFGELLAAPSGVGARHVVRSNPDRVLELEVPDSGVVQDIDTPEDYGLLQGKERPDD